MGFISLPDIAACAGDGICGSQLPDFDKPIEVQSLATSATTVMLLTMLSGPYYESRKLSARVF